MSDALKSDLLRTRAKDNLEKAQQLEKNGEKEKALVFYEKSLEILQMLQKLEGGKAEERLHQRVQQHVSQLKGEDPDFDLDENTGSDGSCSGTEFGSDSSDVDWELFEASQPDIDFSDIGGRQRLIKEIQQVFLDPINEKEEHDYYNLDTPNGLLLYGPPGTGKTYTAKAIGGELDATFVHVRSGDLKSKYKGESESNATELFDKARSDQPCILFFDEADALFTNRDEHNSDGDLTNAILREISELEGEDVFVVGATNNAKRLDPAILRNGRMDKKVKVGLPSKETRLAILEKMSENFPVDPRITDLRSVADDTHGYSAADLEAIMKNAARKAKEENTDINHQHLKQAVKETNPSVYDT